MEKRIVLCSVAMFLIGWAVGAAYPQEIFRILAPGMWYEARLTAVLLFSFLSGIPLGCLFASAPLAVLITRRLERWKTQAVLNLLVGCLTCFSISRLHPGLIETEFGHELGYSRFLFSPLPLTELPLAGATCVLFVALAVRFADILNRYTFSRA